MSNPMIEEARQRMGKALEVMNHDLKAVRTGRATPALIDSIKADYYGAPAMLKTLATISALEPQLLVVKPFDPGSLAEITKAI